MKDSHFRTPRQLSDCIFPTGSVIAEIDDPLWGKYFRRGMTFFAGAIFGLMVAQWF